MHEFLEGATVEPVISNPEVPGTINLNLLRLKDGEQWFFTPDVTKEQMIDRVSNFYASCPE